jgi:hypothetical protein
VQKRDHFEDGLYLEIMGPELFLHNGVWNYPFALDDALEDGLYFLIQGPLGLKDAWALLPPYTHLG